MCTPQENAYSKCEVRNWSILIQTDNWLKFIRRFSHEFLISFNIDILKIMRLLFLLSLSVQILLQSAQRPSFHMRFHGSSSIPIASFVKRLFIKTFQLSQYVRKTQNSAQLWSHGTFNPAVIAFKEVYVVYSNINKDDEASHNISNAKRRSLKVSD